MPFVITIIISLVKIEGCNRDLIYFLFYRLMPRSSKKNIVLKVLDTYRCHGEQNDAGCDISSSDKNKCSLLVLHDVDKNESCHKLRILQKKSIKKIEKF